jgi:uncharacterized membrane protein YgcG
MFRWFTALLALLLLALPAAAQEVPPYRGQVIQDEAGILTAQQAVELTGKLAAYSPERYTVLFVRSAVGADMTDYLDMVWEAWRLPANSILVVVFTEGRNVRLYMGGEIGRYGVTVETLVRAAREVFSPLAREGRFADAVGALAAYLHDQVVAGGGQPAGAIPAGAAQVPAAPPGNEPLPRSSQTTVQPGVTAQAPERPASSTPLRTLRRGMPLSLQWGLALIAAGAVFVFVMVLTGRRSRPVRRA